MEHIETYCQSAIELRSYAHECNNRSLYCQVNGVNNNGYNVFTFVCECVCLSVCLCANWMTPDEDQYIQSYGLQS